MRTRLSRKVWSRLLIAAAGVATVALLTLAPLNEAAAQRRPRGKKKSDFQAMMPAPISHDAAGFRPIFDGKSLAGWDGDPKHWRTEGGMIVGESTADNPLERNTFLVWRGGRPADFELVLEYRINSTNSGIQYRSVELPEVGKWVLKGYQADIDAENRFTGQIYEERGRGFLALRGQYSYVGPGKKARVAGELGDGDTLKALIKNGDWNRLHIIARGNQLTQILNDRVMSMVTDDDPDKRSAQGLIGVQLHVGPPMKIELRNVMLKTR